MVMALYVSLESPDSDPPLALLVLTGTGKGIEALLARLSLLPTLSLLCQIPAWSVAIPSPIETAFLYRARFWLDAEAPALRTPDLPLGESTASTLLSTLSPRRMLPRRLTSSSLILRNCSSSSLVSFTLNKADLNSILAMLCSFSMMSLPRNLGRTARNSSMSLISRWIFFSSPYSDRVLLASLTSSTDLSLSLRSFSFVVLNLACASRNSRRSYWRSVICFFVSSCSSSNALFLSSILCFQPSLSLSFLSQLQAGCS